MESGDDYLRNMLARKYDPSLRSGSFDSTASLLQKHRGSLGDQARGKYTRPVLPSIVPKDSKRRETSHMSITFQEPPVTSTDEDTTTTAARVEVSDPGDSPAVSPSRRSWAGDASGDTSGSVSPKAVSFPKMATLKSLIYTHLKSMNLTESAEMFLKEEGVETGSAVSQVLEKSAGSPLQRLFSRNSTTDAIIDQLLKDTPGKLIASAHHFFDQDTMHHLIQMALQPMWSTHHSKVYLKHGSGTVNIARCGALRAATLNQLIERVSKVIHQQQTARTPAELHLDAQALQVFLRTYKHFCAPHTLLAKLFQRWFVPMGLPFTDSYSNYFVMIHGWGNNRTSAKFWESVSIKIRHKVSGILLDWIREFPEDWDEMMIHTLETFIDDNYYTANPGNPGVQSQFILYAESIKVSLKEVVASRHEKHQPGVVDVPLDEGDIEAPLTLFSDELDETVLATQITSVDHDLLRQINVRELLDFTKNEMHFLNLQASANGSFVPATAYAGAGSAASTVYNSFNGMGHLGSMNASGSNFVAPGSPLPTFRSEATERTGLHAVNGKAGWAKCLSQLFHRSQALQKWVVAELVTTECDVDRARKLQKFVGVAYKLLEMNNLQACQSMVFAFNHPALQRMTRFMQRVECLSSIEMLQKFFSDPGCNMQIKKLMADISPEDRDLNPPVPCLGVWVSDLQLIEEAEPTVLLDNGVGLIHWRKYQAISTIFTRFADIQGLVVPPPFYKNQRVQAFLNMCMDRCKHLENTGLLELSHCCEPA